MTNGPFRDIAEPSHGTAESETLERTVNLVFQNAEENAAAVAHAISEFVGDSAATAERLEARVVSRLKQNGCHELKLFYRVLDDVVGPHIDDRFHEVSPNDFVQKRIRILDKPTMNQRAVRSVHGAAGCFQLTRIRHEKVPSSSSLRYNSVA